MKLSHVLLLVLLAGAPAGAQINFVASGLPHTVGEYSRAYQDTDADVTALTAVGTGAQWWDLSQAQQPTEVVVRTDIIPAADGVFGDNFPDAVYAEQETVEPGSAGAWRYYTLTSTGRVYYGFYTFASTGFFPPTFDPPTIDVPAEVHPGRTWTRSLSWPDIVFDPGFNFVPISNYFIATASVDAYGTLVLPKLGPTPALRVHETHGYFVTETITNSLVDIHTNQYYYWLVPGLGVAAQVLLYGNNTVHPPTPLPYTNATTRLFEANYFTNATGVATIGALNIHLQNGVAALDWPETNSPAGYRLESASRLFPADWQLLGLPTSNLWFDGLTSTQRFYRVFGRH